MSFPALGRASAGALGALVAATAIGATAIAAVPGAAPGARTLFAFAFEPRPGSLADAAAVLQANLGVAAIALLGCLIARQRLVRVVFDGALACVLGLNMLLIGAAIGAYGARTAAWLVHLPLELGGLALAAGAYRLARRGELSGPQAGAALAGVVGLLVAGALVETFLTPQR